MLSHHNDSALRSLEKQARLDRAANRPPWQKYLVLASGLLLLCLGSFLGVSIQRRPHSSVQTVTIVTLLPQMQQAQEIKTVALDTDQFRQIIATSSTRQITITAAEGNRASGALIFQHTSGGPITISSGVLTSKNGVAIWFEGFTLPAAPSQLTRNGIAVNPGTAGNIAALTLDGPCCGNGAALLVKNAADFTGGMDPHPASTVQWSDADYAAGMVDQPLITEAQQDVQAQMFRTEQIADGLQTCDANIAFTDGFTAQVSVSVTCSTIVFAQEPIEEQLMSDLNVQVFHHYFQKTGDVLIWSPWTIRVLAATFLSEGQLELTIQGQADWMYRIPLAFLLTVAQQIAGKSMLAARSWLLRQPGIVNVRFSSPGNLPATPHNIRVIVSNEGGVL